MNRELVSLARNPIPSGVRQGEFAAADGTLLRYAIWPPSRSPRRGTVCLFGGRTEFIEKYFEVVADLRRRGFTVATMDWRGQGGSQRPLSDPRKGHVRDFSQFDGDLTRFMRDVVMPDCPPPLTALAHSMGGNIILRSAGRPGCWFEKIVLCAPMIELAPVAGRSSNRGIQFAIETLAAIGMGRAYVPGGNANAGENANYENNVLTTDRERFTRNRAVLQSAPDLGLGSPTVGWMRAALRSMDFIKAENFVREVRTPVLFVIAGDDSVVSPRAIEDYAQRLKLASHIIIPGARHEILQEADDKRQLFWSAFDAFHGIDQTQPTGGMV